MPKIRGKVWGEKEEKKGVGTKWRPREGRETKRVPRSRDKIEGYE